MLKIGSVPYNCCVFVIVTKGRRDILLLPCCQSFQRISQCNSLLLSFSKPFNAIMKFNPTYQSVAVKPNILKIEIFLCWYCFRLRFLGMRVQVFQVFQVFETNPKPLSQLKLTRIFLVNYCPKAIYQSLISKNRSRDNQ